MPDNLPQEIPLMPMAGQEQSPPDLDKVLDNQLSQVPTAGETSVSKFPIKKIAVIVAAVLVLGGVGAAAYYFITKTPTPTETTSTPPTIANPFASKDESDTNTTLTDVTTETTTATPEDTTETPDNPPSLNLPSNPPADNSVNTDLQIQVDTLKTTSDSAASVSEETTLTDESTTPKKVPRR